MSQLQSAYRRHHSTETALLKVFDVYATIDRQQVTLLGLLDLSAAFESLCCVGYAKSSVGLFVELHSSCIATFLLGRSQQVYYKGRLSVKLQLLFGMPQWSALGPLLFLMCLIELFDVIAECGGTGHAYGDDTPTLARQPQTILMRRIV